MQRGNKITEEEKEKLQAKEILKSDEDMDTKMEALMKLLFEKEERETYEKRYQGNRKKAEEFSIIKVLKFGTVDFKKIYEEVREEKGIIDKLRDIKKKISFGAEER
ncbi:MAG: hypothetical protein HFJ37_02045 [Clostridia bacterium]|nr:hypothetical protein [Clostridia bacterium]